ncbi:MAG TPA: nickel pincer cofactor biosynthesis protein LarC [Pyrinomonadaceae bacterium]|nr:nickel pincer cofactor biosynthesis protein LarC [Pyrinomonadaceae bacterium]
MRTLYFDCFAGASGDMILGALVGAGVDERLLLEQLSLLGLGGYEIEFGQVDRSGISCVKANVRVPHEHAHRHLGDILKIIYESGLSDSVKERAARIFSRLAEAEARVHNMPVERIHFHEVGAMDAILDVAGACIGFEALGIERFASSALHVGSGMVEMAHGRFPVPPPAVAELLKDAPVYSSDITGELVTPTGAAIISTVASQYGALPAMKIERVAYGAGSRDYQGFPNALRIMMGESEAVETDGKARGGHEPLEERLVMLETNIDDMAGQRFGYLMERALETGALDCFFTPVQMKKNRPGLLVSILCKPEDSAGLSELLFRETTTLGVRETAVTRRALERTILSVETRFGRIDVKVAHLQGQVMNEMPEYEQCLAAARRAGVELSVVEDEVRAALSALRAAKGES